MERASTVDRTIAQQEVRRFARLLADEIAQTSNARDFWLSLNDTIRRYDEGEDA